VTTQQAPLYYSDCALITAPPSLSGRQFASYRVCVSILHLISLSDALATQIGSFGLGVSPFNAPSARADCAGAAVCIASALTVSWSSSSQYLNIGVTRGLLSSLILNASMKVDSVPTYKSTLCIGARIQSRSRPDCLCGTRVVSSISPVMILLRWKVSITSDFTQSNTTFR
jgi:hypothetical protein